MELGEAIRRRREELRLSQEYVAERLGVSRQAVSKWETGQSEPTAGNLVQLAEVLEIGLSQLVDPYGSGREAAAPRGGGRGAEGEEEGAERGGRVPGGRGRRNVGARCR